MEAFNSTWVLLLKFGGGNMLKCVDGKYIEMTPEEIATLQEDVVEPTTEERLAALEAAMLEQILKGGAV